MSVFRPGFHWLVFFLVETCELIVSLAVGEGERDDEAQVCGERL